MLGVYSPEVTVPNLTLKSLWDLFNGELPLNIPKESRDWLLDPSKTKLRLLVLKAFRFSVKMVIDEMIQGETESMNELEETLDSYRQDWFISLDKQHESSVSSTFTQKMALEQGIPHLFLLYKQKETGVICIRLLSKQESTLKLASVNPESIHGIWANLAFELLYLTNDDDERYSIQAHELILRNLMIQLAAPPFGYPIWTTTGYIPLSNIHDLI